MTVALLADENFDGKIVRAVRRLSADADIVTVQDLGHRAAPDPVVLELGATHGRVVLTHDAKTVPGFAFDRVRRGLSMPGAVVVPWGSPIGPAASDIQLIIECTLPDELEGRVMHVPLR